MALSKRAVRKPQYVVCRDMLSCLVPLLEQLEKRVQAHNNLIERTYKLEERAQLQEEKMKVANHRIEDLESALRR